MYRYLLFDLDDTLLDFKGAEAMAIRRVFADFGIDTSDETVQLYSAINDSYWKRLERGEIERSQIYEGRFRTLSERLGQSFDTAAVSGAYFKALSCCGHTFPDAIPLLERLKQKGYIMAAVTNGSLAPQTGRIVASGIAGYFTGGLYISEQIGHQKPQKEYFEHVLQALGHPPREEILLLGDSPSGDMAGAIGMGLDCCFVNLRGQALPASIHPTYTVTALMDIPTVCGLSLQKGCKDRIYQ